MIKYDKDKNSNINNIINNFLNEQQRILGEIVVNVTRHSQLEDIDTNNKTLSLSTCYKINKIETEYKKFILLKDVIIATEKLEEYLIKNGVGDQLSQSLLNSLKLTENNILARFFLIDNLIYISVNTNKAIPSMEIAILIDKAYSYLNEYSKLI